MSISLSTSNFDELSISISESEANKEVDEKSSSDISIGKKEPGVLILECKVQEGSKEYNWERRIDLHSGVVGDFYLNSNKEFEPPSSYQIGYKLSKERKQLLQYLYWHRRQVVTYNEIGKNAFRYKKRKNRVQRLTQKLRYDLGESGKSAKRIKNEPNLGYKFQPLSRDHEIGPDMVARKWDGKSAHIVPDAPDSTYSKRHSSSHEQPLYSMPRYSQEALVMAVSEALYKDSAESEQIRKSLRYWRDNLSDKAKQRIAMLHFVASHRCELQEEESWEFVKDILLGSQSYKEAIEKEVERKGLPADLWHEVKRKNGGDSPRASRYYDKYARAKGYEKKKDEIEIV